MITDKIVNISLYNEIPDDILKFIKDLSPDIPCGCYQINETDYVNVEEYETKVHENCFFEAHKQYIDIQILLNGIERLDYVNIDKLTVKVPYDETKDIIFYKNPDKISNSVILEKGNFVFLYPHDAHKPQMQVKNSKCKVKKAVVKIRIQGNI